MQAECVDSTALRDSQRAATLQPLGASIPHRKPWWRLGIAARAFMLLAGVGTLADEGGSMRTILVGVSLLISLSLLVLGLGGTSLAARGPSDGVADTPQAGSAPSVVADPNSPTATMSVQAPSPIPSPSAVMSVASSGTVLYEADWTGGLSGWTGPSDWKTLNGMLLNDGTNESIQPIAAPYQPPTPDYAIETEVQILKAAYSPPGHSFGLVARYTGENESYTAGVREDAVGNKLAGIADLSARWGPDFTEGVGTSQVFDPGEDWHTYRLELKGNTLKLLVDGSVLVQGTDNRFLSAGRVGLWSQGYQLQVRSFKVIAL